MCHSEPKAKNLASYLKATARSFTPFRMTMKWLLCFVLVSTVALPPVEPASEVPPSTPPSLTGVVQTLLNLLDKQDKTNITADDYQSTSLQQIIKLATPAGYRIKLRYLDFGVSLVEALKAARDPELRRRLIEMVQWSRNPKVRAEAILTLATFSDPSHKKYFKEALLDSKTGIRFAAVEALQTWNQADSIPLLKMAMDRDWSPLMQVFAAQALLSLGEQNAIQVLWKHLDHNSWVVRAMAARYLGDYGHPDDYTKIVDHLNSETRNNYVLAELSIAALKLISKKGEKVAYSPASPGWRENEEVKYALGKDNVIELEPLIIVPPQLRIPPALLAASKINTLLLDLIENHLGEELDKIQAQDPVVQDLNAMVTPSGFALKMRYSELSYLVVEGLAGTQDLLLRSELKRLAAESENPLVRASALIALAYNRNEDDLYLIQAGLDHKNEIVRFGAMEAIEVGRFRSAVPSLVGIAMGDSSPALQVYALNILSKFGDASGRNLLISHLSNPDWPARAMAYWYLSRYGRPDDYSLALARLASEENPFVQAEIVLAVLRLSPL